MASLDDEDNFPNDFDGVDFDNIPGLQAPAAGGNTPASTSRSTVPPPMSCPSPSLGSDSVEDMDSSFLAEVDALEARALSKMIQGSQPSSSTASGDLPADDTHKPPSANGKGKEKAECQDSLSIRAALAGYEAELTCPICCDLLVAAHVTNPCGHTCCGVCIHEWLQRNKCEPNCAVCRSKLVPRKPVLPNFSMDSLVHQHLQILAKSGRPEWQEKGYKTVEWNKRLESWKKQNAARITKEKLKESSRPRRRRPRHYGVGDYSYSIDEDHEDAIVVHVSPRRGSRARY